MDAQNLRDLLVIGSVSLLAAISPGPDFLIVVRNNLVYSRRSGYFTALGVSLALIIHLFYTLVGIGVLIAESPLIYNLIKYAGILYLFYLGVTSIYSSFKKTEELGLKYTKAEKDLLPLKAIQQGFFTNLLNPKCALFFISLFSQLISPETPWIIRIEFALVNWSVTLSWFCFLSYIITGKFLASKMDRFRNSIDRIMGALLMLLSARMLFA